VPLRRIESISERDLPMTDQSPETVTSSTIPVPLAGAVRDAAGKAGAAAANAWANAALHGRNPHDAAEVARTALTRLGNATDPDDMATADTDPRVLATAYAAAAGAEAPRFHDIVPTMRDRMLTEYTDTHTRVRRQHAAVHCRTALAGPVPAKKDWSHLAQDRVRIGGIAVFAGDWTWYRTGDGDDRIRVGFVGVLIDTWNGWAVFTCTRAVAEAIAADQGRMRADLHAWEVARGLSETDAAAGVDASMAQMWFDGDTLIVDQRTVDQDPDSIDRITARDDGTWVVMGWNWCWTLVEPGDCDTVIGDLPMPDSQQVYVALTHVPAVRVPHDRFRVADSTLVDGNPQLVAYGLADDGEPVGQVVVDRRIGAREVRSADPDAEAMIRAFAEQCRRFGEPMSVPEVIDALIQEYDLGEYARRADADGYALVRLLDADGHVRHVRMLTIQRRARLQALRELVHRTGIPGGVTWELWTGRGWLHFTNAPSTAATDE
jgi:hypothetical protein